MTDFCHTLNNVILIGMPGSGKSTVGRPLAEFLGFQFIDTDQLIEAGEQLPLSEVVVRRTRDEFIALEAKYIQTITSTRCVISTGGSVIYDQIGMQHLAKLGSVVFLDVTLDLLLHRVDDLAARGVVIAPGKTIADLLNERRPYYLKYADLVVTCEDSPPEQNAQNVLTRLNALTKPTDQAQR